MKNSHLLVLLSLAIATASPAFARELILITSFEPFRKWDVNLSHEVATEISKLKNLVGESVDIEICRLPVVFDKASERAIQCFEKLEKKPDLILSMGEGTCEIRLETAATNLDHSPEFPDNAGVTRTMAQILPGRDKRVGFTFPVQEMYCALQPQDAKGVRVSVSPGNYVCNNTAFHLSNELADKGIPYGFIHVPHSGCTPEVRNVKNNAAIIAQMLHAALSEIQSKKPLTALPRTQAEVDALIQGWKDQKSPSCRLDFLKRMRTEYLENIPKSKDMISF